MKRGECDVQSTYVSHKVDGAIIEILKEYFNKIKLTQKDVALERRYKAQISDYKRRQTKLGSEVERLKKQVVELSSEIGRSLIGESRFTPDMLSASIENTNKLLNNKENEMCDVKYKLANQQNAFGKLDFYYSQFKTWAEEFEESSLEQQKMIACQLIRQVRVFRGYKIEVEFDINYEQFVTCI